MNRIIDVESLRMENFRLKNEITDLKNGFDLNRDVLRILESQVKEAHPQFQIFYQVISRLTGINNQIMIRNIELIQEKSKLMTENKKLQNTIESVSERFEEVLQSKDCLNPKEIHMEMRDQIKQLRAEMLALHQECLTKNIQISRLKEIIKSKQIEQLKKPIIPSVKKVDNSELPNISLPKKYEAKQILRMAIINKNLQRENSHLKKLVEELQYRLTLFARLYQEEPANLRKKSVSSDDEVGGFKRLAQSQLNLFMFALNNTHIEEDTQNDGAKLTITNRCRMFMGQNRKLTKSVSSIF